MTIKLYVIGDKHNFSTPEEAKKFKKKLIKNGQDGVITDNSVVVTGNFGPRRLDTTNYKRGLKGNYVKKDKRSKEEVKEATALIRAFRRRLGE